ncbi:MAG: SusC/RagA family TonB-linked outer membrane protein [Bacteroidales bacterium]|nr:SusC/RagA family TonB-linked outer membrane protein [Bacteroidales bacterium]
MKKLTIFLAFLLFVGFSVQAQMQISGTVTGAEDGLSIPGVSVVVKDNTTIGTTTDMDGKYTITVPSNAQALLFSFVGLKAQEAAINGLSVIDIQMETEVLEMDAVVVTALGITREKKALGYSVQDVSGDEFTKAREANVVNSLSGKVPGVNITQSSGAVGASTRIELRGASSLTGNTQPLFIVDGIPVDGTNYGSAYSGGGYDLPNGVGDINPDDIATLSILKGPSAAALYGVRASNGVIVITTKTGKQGKNNEIGVSFNSTTQFDNPLVIPDFQNSYGQGSSKDYFEWIDGTAGDGGVDESWGPPLDVGLEFVQWDNYKYDGGPSPWVSEPDNVKNFYETGITTTNNLSFSNGDEKMSYRLSLGHMSQTGMIPNTDFTRVNISANASYNFTDKLKAGFNVSYSRSSSDNLASIGYTDENPVQQTIWGGRNVNWEDLKDYENIPLSPVGTPSEGTPINWNTQFQNNPYWALNTNFNTHNKDRVLGGVNLSYQLTDYLTVIGKSVIDTWSQKNTVIRAYGTNSYPSGFYSETDRRYSETNSDILIMFNKEVSSDFDVSLNLGGNMMSRSYTRQYGEAPQLELPEVYTLSNLKSGSTPVNVGRTEESEINSIYGQGAISYKNAVFLDFTGRNDWASVLPIDNNSFFYPSVNLGVIITDLLEMKSPILSFAKVRAGWSKVGGIGVLDPYQLEQTFQYRATPWGSTALLYNPDQLNNPNIKPEAKTATEFGLDLRFFNNRLRLDATYFSEVNTDLIVPVEVSATTGYITTIDNIGEMTNKGIEILLGITAVKTKDLTVGFDINYYKNENEVTDLGGQEALNLGGQWNMDLQAREGLPWGVIYGPGFVRDDNGEIVHENGVPVKDEEYKILGNIQPDWRGGITMNVSYKGINLSTTLDGKFGGDIYTMTTTWGRYAGVLEETLLGRESGIVGEGVMWDDATDTYVTNNVVVSAKTYNTSAYDNAAAESSVFDASYVKWRQLVISYDLPTKWFEGTPFQKASIGFVGRNLAILYKNAPHIDPESSFSSDNAQQGQEFGQLPSTRSLGFNININF